MWHADSTQIRYYPWWDDAFHFSYFVPDFSLTAPEIITIPQTNSPYTGYDAWVHQYNREEEISLVQSSIESLRDTLTRRVHIAGISCAESVDLISEYYRLQWYHDDQMNQYQIPTEAPLTASTTLRHILWCEKDKKFLWKKDSQWVPYYATFPPVRFPSDLRVLQQSARMNMLLGIEVMSRDEQFLGEIFQKQILTPFQLSQLVYYRWKQFWFSGEKYDFSLPFPNFSEAF